MPWEVKKSGNKYAIYRSDTGKIVGHSTSRKKAEASVKARYWATSKKGEKLHDSGTGNISAFARAIALTIELNDIEQDTKDIGGIIYCRIPDSILQELSGSAATFLGVKKIEGKGYVPKDRYDELIEANEEIQNMVAEPIGDDE